MYLVTNCKPYLVFITMLTKEQRLFRKAFLTLEDRKVLLDDIKDTLDGFCYEQEDIENVLNTFRSYDNLKFRQEILEYLPYLEDDITPSENLQRY